VSLLTLVCRCPCPYVAAGRHSRPMVDGRMWAAIFVCGWPASFFGRSWWRCGRWWSLAFVGDHEGGGGEEHGGGAVTSMVGGGGKKLIAKQTLFVCLGRSLTCSNSHVRSSHV